MVQGGCAMRAERQTVDLTAYPARWTRSEPHRRGGTRRPHRGSSDYRAGVLPSRGPMGNDPHGLESSDDAMAPDQGSGVNSADNQRASAKS